MKLTREFYIASIPQHAQKITVKVDGSVIYKWAADGKILLKAFKGKSAKPSFYYSYKNDESANKKISAWIESLRIMNAAKIRDKAEKNQPHNIKIGDIFRSTWGYDQTNVEFWECVSVSGALITVREIAQQREYTESMSGNCLPIPGKFIGAEKKCRVQYGTRIKVSDCAHASLLDFTEIAGMKIFKSTGFSCYA